MKIQLASIALLKFCMGNEHYLTGRKNSKVGRSLAIQGSVVLYTTNADFDSGSLVNINYNDRDELKLDNSSEPFNFIWVACSSRGTVVKVDTLNGTILGEYSSAPRSDGSPSRTTVDKDGSVWLANRADIGPQGGGTIVHIGLAENNQCEERNGIPGIQTSTGLGDIKPWADATGNRSVSTAQDECIVHYTEVNSRGTRHVSIDSDNNVWVSGLWNRAFDKVKGGRWTTPGSGEILVSFPSVGYGGYGGLMDPNGFIWSSSPLLRWDTSLPLNGTNGDPSGPSIGPLALNTNWAGQVDDSYGLCIDSQGNVWSTSLSSGQIVKYASNGTYLGNFAYGGTNAQGCVVDLNDDVWVAHSILNQGTTVGHLANNGTLLGVVMVGSGPSGVAVDRMGKVWSTNTIGSTLSRIDPSLNNGVGSVDKTIDLGSGCYPYNYGDMTGSTNISPPNSGSWTVTYDHGFNFTAWGSIEWTADTPDNSSLTVQVKKEEGDPWMSVNNGQELSNANLTGFGQYLYVQVSFFRALSGASPVLKDLSIGKTDGPTTRPTVKPIKISHPTATKAGKSGASPTMKITSAPTTRPSAKLIKTRRPIATKTGKAALF